MTSELRLWDPAPSQGLAGLGRLHVADVRDHKFRLRQLGMVTAYKMWNNPGIYDQGGTSQCVSYATKKYLTAGPVTNPLSKHPWDFQQFYDLCQDNDEWPGDSYEGTSIRAAFKVAKAAGLISEYNWGFDEPTVRSYVGFISPMVAGTYWYLDMFTPDRWGYIHPTGPLAGGHAYLLVGLDPGRKHPLTGHMGAYRLANAYGPGWGQQGRAWISFEHMAQLIENWGECALAQEIKK
jgi:C1A family cysteine protease